MTPIILFLISLCFLVTILDIALIILWSFGNSHDEIDPLPRVSILVAARNEAHNILRCIESLGQIDYPADRLEILVGDDASEDQTFDIAETAARRYQHIRVFQITENIGLARGKANVLAHLARRARGDIFFIVDADVAVSPVWVKEMLRGYDPAVGIVSGVTAVEGHALQNVDWIFALGMVKILTDLGHPVTAIGNNMYVSREAYEAVGGYESIPFSVTEDLELFRQVRAKGYKVVQRFDKGTLAQTKPVAGFISLLKQRKRWMSGAIQLPLPVVSVLALQAAYYPTIIILFFLNYKIGAIAFLVKLLLQSTFISMLQSKLRQRINSVVLVLFEFYAAGISFSSLVYFLIPGKIIWKGRKY